MACPGQGGDQRDEGAARTQREHAEEHPTQPRGPTLPREGPGQRGLCKNPLTPKVVIRVVMLVFSKKAVESIWIWRWGKVL